MEKVTIQLKDMNNKKVKYNGSIIEIKPYINDVESILINDIVRTNYFFQIEKNGQEDIHLFAVRLNVAYFMAVLKMCTNIDTEEIKNNEYYKYYVSLKDIILNNIENYLEVLDNIKFGITNKIIDDGIEKVIQDIPTIEDSESIIESISKESDKILKNKEVQNILQEEIISSVSKTEIDKIKDKEKHEKENKGKEKTKKGKSIKK